MATLPATDAGMLPLLREFILKCVVNAAENTAKKCGSFIAAFFPNRLSCSNCFLGSKGTLSYAGY